MAYNDHGEQIPDFQDIFEDDLAVGPIEDLANLLCACAYGGGLLMDAWQRFPAHLKPGDGSAAGGFRLDPIYAPAWARVPLEAYLPSN